MTKRYLKKIIQVQLINYDLYVFQHLRDVDSDSSTDAE